ncbi:hypothetical protein [Nostoc sp.]|uniref:hypothetical protein n=1 Tax=Nostoc sp. TaxID=1180 RepID=UPI002FF48444
MSVFPKHQLLGENHMAITAEKTLLNNQSILQNFCLVEELDEQAAEIISGGYDTFTVKNKTNRFIPHRLDGSYYVIRPGEERIYAGDPGMIEFDTDTRPFHYKPKSWPLVNGKTYEFRDDNSTPESYDIDIYE